MRRLTREQIQARRKQHWPWMPAAFALAGVILFIFATYGPPASSSGFVSTVKGLLNVANPDYTEAKQHYRMIPGPGSWLMAFVVGMAIGGFIGGRFLGRKIDDVPPIWKTRFGPRRIPRLIVCFVGGFLILFSARLAGGCTLGLFISGSTQLAVSGLLFGVLIFAFAMLTARLVYGNAAKPEEEEKSS